MLRNANSIQACQILMRQSLIHRHNLQGRKGCRQVQRLQKKVSSRQMSDTRGSSPNTTTELWLMVKVQDLDQAIEGLSNVHPRDRQVGTMKMMDPVGLMVRYCDLLGQRKSGDS